MATVYVVTSGEHDEYEIQGICSTPEKGEAFLAEFNATQEWYKDGGRIEEWDLDVAQPKPRGSAHGVEMNLTTGEMEVKNVEFRGICVNRARTTVEPFSHDGHEYLTVTSSVSPEHAAKVAVEKRQEWLRTRS